MLLANAVNVGIPKPSEVEAAASFCAASSVFLDAASLFGFGVSGDPSLAILFLKLFLATYTNYAFFDY